MSFCFVFCDVEFLLTLVGSLQLSLGINQALIETFEPLPLYQLATNSDLTPVLLDCISPLLHLPGLILNQFQFLLSVLQLAPDLAQRRPILLGQSALSNRLHTLLLGFLQFMQLRCQRFQTLKTRL